MAITIAFQLWCMLQGEGGGRRAGQLLQQQRMPVQLGSACVCAFLFLVHFPFFFAFFIYAGSCKNFQFYEFTFWPARRRKRRVGGESRVAVLLADPAADLLPALQLQPNCQLDSPNFSLEFALFAVPHKSVQYFLYETPLSSSLSPLFVTFFQLHLLCRYLS